MFTAFAVLFCICTLPSTHSVALTGCKEYCSGDDSNPCTSGSESVYLGFKLFHEGTASTTWSTEYGSFCPEVDQFAALSLTSTNDSNKDGAGKKVTWKDAPNPLSLNLTMLVDNNRMASVVNNMSVVGVGYRDGTEQCKRAYASILVLNLTLDSGKWKEDSKAGIDRVGTGWQATCDSSGYCKFDSNGVCLGPDSGKNGVCAVCDTGSLKETDAQPLMFTAWYGKDDGGKVLTSGGKNPLNFQLYSIGNFISMYNDAKSSAEDAYNDAKDQDLPSVPYPPIGIPPNSVTD